MLVLTRKLMEKLFIGDNICVTVVRLEGGQVRLGIEAPGRWPSFELNLYPSGTGKRSASEASIAAPTSCPAQTQVLTSLGS